MVTEPLPPCAAFHHSDYAPSQGILNLLNQEFRACAPTIILTEQNLQWVPLLAKYNGSLA